MSSNINMNDISKTHDVKLGTVIPSLNSAQSYDVNKEQNSKVRYLMSYYGY